MAGITAYTKSTQPYDELTVEVVVLGISIRAPGDNSRFVGKPYLGIASRLPVNRELSRPVVRRNQLRIKRALRQDEHDT